MSPTLADFRADPLLWSRIGPIFYRSLKMDLQKTSEVAFNALDHWNTTATTEKDSVTGPAINGALYAIVYFVNARPEDAHETIRRISTYFGSRNINVAFSAIRHFVWSDLSSYTIHVANQLIKIACCANPLKSPVEMTLRGIAFQALYVLDPQYKFWPQLREARDECVHGLRTWGGSDERSIRAAAQIMRYCNSAA